MLLQPLLLPCCGGVSGNLIFLPHVFLSYLCVLYRLRRRAHSIKWEKRWKRRRDEAKSACFSYFFAREARWCDNIKQMYIHMYIRTQHRNECCRSSYFPSSLSVLGLNCGLKLKKPATLCSQFFLIETPYNLAILYIYFGYAGSTD